MQADSFVQRIAQGDIAVQLRLYRETASSVYATAFHLLRDAADAEDVTHDTYIQAFQKIKQLKNPEHPLPWLKAIARNLALKELRRQQRLQIGGKDIDVSRQSEFIQDNGEEFETPSVSVSELREAMDRLSDGYRVVLYLHLIEDMKHEEIAKELGLASSTVRSQYLRARHKLIQELNFIPR